jgi:tRNA nucleotidyltransferase (CCA-adding enzyme)
MPDYMYALESRLTPEQRATLMRVQELVRSQELNVYLSGGAVRDLVCGLPIRDLDFTVEGNPSRMIEELEKGGARVTHRDHDMRSAELIFAGDVSGSISAARDELYERPGNHPEIRWTTITNDLRRRDFSINAIALSLNPNSQGLLLDPANGQADLDRKEVRALSMHSFTNYPVRLLRVLRFCARLDFKMEGRTAEWFDLAISRGMQERMDASEVGEEVRQLCREENIAGVLKVWGSKGLLVCVHRQFPRRRPSEDELQKLSRARESLTAGGLRPRLFVPSAHYMVKRFPAGERMKALRQWRFSVAESTAVANLVAETQKLARYLNGRKANDPREAYATISKAPLDLITFILAEDGRSPAANRIRSYIQKWRPIRLGLPVGELEALGVPRGPKFDKILEDFFGLEIRGKIKDPLDRPRILRQVAGIREETARKAEPKRSESKRAETKKKLRERGGPAPGTEAASAAAAQEKKPEPSAPVGKKRKPTRAARMKKLQTGRNRTQATKKKR